MSLLEDLMKEMAPLLTAFFDIIDVIRDNNNTWMY